MYRKYIKQYIQYLKTILSKHVNCTSISPPSLRREIPQR